MSGSDGEGKLFWHTSKKVHCEPSRHAQYFRLFPQNVLRQTPQDVTVGIDKIYAEQRAAFRLGNSGVFNLKKNACSYPEIQMSWWASRWNHVETGICASSLWVWGPKWNCRVHSASGQNRIYSLKIAPWTWPARWPWACQIFWLLWRCSQNTLITPHMLSVHLQWVIGHQWVIRDVDKGVGIRETQTKMITCDNSRMNDVERLLIPFHSSQISRTILFIWPNLNNVSPKLCTSWRFTL